MPNEGTVLAIANALRDAEDAVFRLLVLAGPGVGSVTVQKSLPWEPDDGQPLTTLRVAYVQKQGSQRILSVHEWQDPNTSSVLSDPCVCERCITRARRPRWAKGF